VLGWVWVWVWVCLTRLALSHTNTDGSSNPARDAHGVSQTVVPRTSHGRQTWEVEGTLNGRPYTHTRIHTYTHTHIHAYTHTHIHICTYAHMHTCTHTHTPIHSYTHTHIHPYIGSVRFLHFVSGAPKAHRRIGVGVLQSCHCRFIQRCQTPL